MIALPSTLASGRPDGSWGRASLQDRVHPFYPLNVATRQVRSRERPILHVPLQLGDTQILYVDAATCRHGEVVLRHCKSPVRIPRPVSPAGLLSALKLLRREMIKVAAAVLCKPEMGIAGCLCQARGV